MKHSFVFGFLLMGLIALSVMAPQLSYADMQGVYKVFLVDSEGTPASAPVSVTVSFYDSEIGGSPYWNETQTVTPESGLYVVNLGQTNPFNVPLDMPLYLGVQVDGNEDGSRMALQGAGSFSQKGGSVNSQSLNVKYEWLDILAQ